MLNQEMFQKVRDYIEANPEQFDMNDWAANNECGTTYCLAGTAAVVDGWKPLFSAYAQYTIAAVFEKDGEKLLAAEIGRDLLGLTRDQASEIFYAESEDDVLRTIKHAADTGEYVFDPR